MLENCRDRTYAKAVEILNKELKGKYRESTSRTYEELRSQGGSGYTLVYLALSFNYSNYSSSINLVSLVGLAKIDLKKGTTIPEMVCMCCKWFPKKQVIQGLIDLGKQTEDDEKVVRSIFEFQNEEGANCFTFLFEIANNRYLECQVPDESLTRDIEESFLFLVDLAKTFKLNLSQIINHTTKVGDTLFSVASWNSERITQFLIDEDVKVNAINDLFETPHFEVRLR